MDTSDLILVILSSCILEELLYVFSFFVSLVLIWKIIPWKNAASGRLNGSSNGTDYNILLVPDELAYVSTALPYESDVVFLEQRIINDEPSLHIRFQNQIMNKNQYKNHGIRIKD